MRLDCACILISSLQVVCLFSSSFVDTQTSALILRGFKLSPYHTCIRSESSLITTTTKWWQCVALLQAKANLTEIFFFSHRSHLMYNRQTKLTKSNFSVANSFFLLRTQWQNLFYTFIPWGMFLFLNVVVYTTL